MVSIEASVGIARKAPETVKNKVIHTPDIKKAPEVGVLHTLRALCCLHNIRFLLDVNHLGSMVHKTKCCMLRKTVALFRSSRSIWASDNFLVKEHMMCLQKPNALSCPARQLNMQQRKGPRASSCTEPWKRNMFHERWRDQRVWHSSAAAPPPNAAALLVRTALRQSSTQVATSSSSSLYAQRTP